MKKAFGLLTILLCAFTLCGCFASFDGARVHRGTRSTASLGMVKEQGTDNMLPTLFFGVRSGYVNKDNPYRNIEVGGLLEAFPGNNPFYFSWDEGGSDNHNEKKTGFQFNLDLKHQVMVNAPFDASLRLRTYIPWFYWPDISLVVGKNIKGNDLYIEAGQNIWSFNALHNEGLNGITLVRCGARFPVSEQIAIVAEAGRSYGYYHAGLGVELR